MASISSQSTLSPWASGLQALQNSPAPSPQASSPHASPNSSAHQSHRPSPGARVPQLESCLGGPPSPLLPHINIKGSVGHTDLAAARAWGWFRMLPREGPAMGLLERRALKHQAAAKKLPEPPLAAELGRTRRLKRIEKQLQIDVDWGGQRKDCDYSTHEGRASARVRCEIEAEDAVSKLASKMLPPPTNRLEFEPDDDNMYANYRVFFEEPITLKSGRNIFLGACHCYTMGVEDGELPTGCHIEDE